MVLLDFKVRPKTKGSFLKGNDMRVECLKIVKDVIIF